MGHEQAEHITGKIEGVRHQISKTREWLDEFKNQTELRLATMDTNEIREFEETFARAESVLEYLERVAPKPKLDYYQRVVEGVHAQISRTANWMENVDELRLANMDHREITELERTIVRAESALEKLARYAPLPKLEL
jgi:hypothetical protein